MSLETAVAYALADTPLVAVLPGDLPLTDAPATSIPSPIARLSRWADPA